MSGVYNARKFVPAGPAVALPAVNDQSGFLSEVQDCVLLSPTVAVIRMQDWTKPDQVFMVVNPKTGQVIATKSLGDNPASNRAVTGGLVRLDAGRAGFLYESDPGDRGEWDHLIVGQITSTGSITWVRPALDPWSGSNNTGQQTSNFNGLYFEPTSGRAQYLYQNHLAAHGNETYTLSVDFRAQTISSSALVPDITNQQPQPGVIFGIPGARQILRTDWWYQEPTKMSVVDVNGTVLKQWPDNPGGYQPHGFQSIAGSPDVAFSYGAWDSTALKPDGSGGVMVTFIQVFGVQPDVTVKQLYRVGPRPTSPVPTDDTSQGLVLITGLVIPPDAITPDTVLGVGHIDDLDAQQIILSGPPGSVRFARLDINTGTVTMHTIDPGTGHPYTEPIVNNGQMVTASVGHYVLIATTTAYHPGFDTPRHADTVFQLFTTSENNLSAGMAKPRNVDFW